MPTEEMVKLMLCSTVETLDLGLQAQIVHKMRSVCQQATQK